MRKIILGWEQIRGNTYSENEVYPYVTWGLVESPEPNRSDWRDCETKYKLFFVPNRESVTRFCWSFIYTSAGAEKHEPVCILQVFNNNAILLLLLPES